MSFTGTLAALQTALTNLMYRPVDEFQRHGPD